MIWENICIFSAFHILNVMYLAVISEGRTKQKCRLFWFIHLVTKDMFKYSLSYFQHQIQVNYIIKMLFLYKLLFFINPGRYLSIGATLMSLLQHIPEYNLLAFAVFFCFFEKCIFIVCVQRKHKPYIIIMC